MEEEEAAHFLESLLSKTLHVTIPDGRLFTGTFRCTDRNSNVIMSNAFEYRMPSKAAEQDAIEATRATGKASKADMTSRFVGLIVIPGKQIAKMEVEDRRDYPSIRPLTIQTRSSS
ncbi:uncharacterized protein A1O9_00950 [Exophiala aquamarina CBS 119918]|uniref:Sm domain-containing protein n=1 Tax=Exophiala aquamarina CBS 119918 TaxID=1182545 RepID=A0A072Q4Y3_9EURO|nr:uncharacterized protein A1O9_00950 [Exophiala aquamarina CBS 119918]KEF62975.1 hypothetical protein A1O9_00950 [Exophiala aquamarina CBS 119918]